LLVAVLTFVGILALHATPFPASNHISRWFNPTFTEMHKRAPAGALPYQAYFNDEEHEIRAILCRGEDRLILAFRGTARVENLLTDLKFHQVSISS